MRGLELQNSWLHSKYGFTCRKYQNKQNSFPPEVINLLKPSSIQLEPWPTNIGLYLDDEDSASDSDEVENSYPYSIELELEEDC